MWWPLVFKGPALNPKPKIYGLVWQQGSSRICETCWRTKWQDGCSKDNERRACDNIAIAWSGICWSSLDIFHSILFDSTFTWVTACLHLWLERERSVRSRLTAHACGAEGLEQFWCSSQDVLNAWTDSTPLPLAAHRYDWDDGWV